MPTFQHAKDAGLGILDSSTTYRNITQYCNKISLSRKAETAEVTTFNSTNDTKAYVAGLKDATVSIEGFWDATIDNYLNGILGTKKTNGVKYFPATTNKTDSNFVQYKAGSILTSYEPPADIGSANTFSAEFQLSGTVTRSTSTG